MPKTICPHDREALAAFFRRDPLLHLYALGDLDDFFWPYTCWYALQEGDQIRQVVLGYTGAPVLILQALVREPVAEMRALLRSIMHLLPRRLYVHLSADLITIFTNNYHIHSYGVHDKMVLTNRARIDAVDTSAVTRLSMADLVELEALYATSYASNWFDPRMLETGEYYGIRQGSMLISVAGVHVYSPQYRIAALGNITTHPAARGRGLATAVTARLCQSLLEHVDQIGLNVKADNASAVACYTKLGFTRTASYGEYSLDMK